MIRSSARAATALCGAVVLIAVLAGCAPSPTTPDEQETPMSNSDVTLESAKAATIIERDAAVALIPADAVGEVTAVDEATLMDCNPGYAWPGSATVVTTGQWDSTAYLGDILDSYSGREGWTVVDSIADEQMVKATSDDGIQVFTSVVKDGGEVWVRAFSQCFDFDPSVGKKY